MESTGGLTVGSPCSTVLPRKIFNSEASSNRQVLPILHLYGNSSRCLRLEYPVCVQGYCVNIQYAFLVTAIISSMRSELLYASSITFLILYLLWSPGGSK